MTSKAEQGGKAELSAKVRSRGGRVEKDLAHGFSHASVALTQDPLPSGSNIRYTKMSSWVEKKSDASIVGLAICQVMEEKADASADMNLI